MKNEGYLNETARQAANAGWGIIGIACALIFLAGLVVLANIVLGAWYYAPLIIVGLIWVLS